MSGSAARASEGLVDGAGRGVCLWKWKDGALEIAEVAASWDDGAEGAVGWGGAEEVAAVEFIAGVKDAQMIALLSGGGAKLADEGVALEVVEPIPDTLVDNDVDVVEPAAL